MKKGLVAILSTACLLNVTGCAGNQMDNATNTGMGNNQTQITRVNHNENGQTDNINNGNLTVQTRAANNVERLDEVDQARVVMRGNDAYVTVRLAQNGNNNQNGYGNNVGNNSATNSGTNGTGMANEYNNVGFNTRTSKIANNTRRNNGTEMAERVNETPTGNNPSTTRPGFGNNTNFTSNVDTNNRNTKALGNIQVSTILEQQIENQVRAAARNVKNVYVSVNGR